jgi:putative sigma-54 modulation protein
MHVDIKARGFALTPALAATIRREAVAVERRLGDRPIWLQVRLFDINGTRGGIDKGCLVTASVNRRRRVFVATSLDRNLYVAIPAAFDKLLTCLTVQAQRIRTLRRRPVVPAISHFS